MNIMSGVKNFMDSVVKNNKKVTQDMFDDTMSKKMLGNPILGVNSKKKITNNPTKQFLKDDVPIINGMLPLNFGNNNKLSWK